jgi:3-dehydroquinate synthase
VRAHRADDAAAHDYVAGLAEVLKVGFTHDPRILELVEQDPEAAKSPAGPHTRELVERAIAVKARVVSDDLTEQGQREFLNYGHTLAHAIEKVENYRWRHGRRGQRRGWCSSPSWAASPAGSTTRPPPGTARARGGRDCRRLRGDWAQVHAAMRIDKKSRGDRLRFVVLDALAQPRMLEDPDPSLLVAAFEEVRKDRSRRCTCERTSSSSTGPTSGRLGTREPEVYGTTTYQQLVALCETTGASSGLTSRSGRPTTRRR